MCTFDAPTSMMRKTPAIKPIPLVDLRAQYAAIQGEIQQAIHAVLDSQTFILGPQVEALEREVSHYCGRRFGIAVASGTDALMLALRVAGVTARHEVIVPAFSFIATAGAVTALGATPVFVDIEPQTFCMNPALLAKHVRPRTRAIVPVHLYGHAADLDSISQVAQENRLALIEDNAQALGAQYKGRRTGSFGDLACLSFYPSKNLGAYGDGGMVLTDSLDMARRLRLLRDHGMVKKYVSEEPGWNSRLDEMQAAILRVKLRYLDEWNSKRRSRAAKYDSLLKAIPGVRIPSPAEWAQPVYHQYTIRVHARGTVQEALSRSGIASAVYYPVPIPLQPIYAGLRHQAGDFPQSELAGNEVLSLPLYPELTDDQIEYVAHVLAEVLH
jgi:dTDP-4-amino-4,6-dideoxygalactose transaminase